ncbi:MAG: histidinol-phosphate transaminase [Ignavibacteriales bacterium]|nr:histidinol-phosphate transaminase [Ignavibacteriales bacterium]
MSFLKHIKPSVQHLEAYSVKSKPLSPDLIKLNQNENPFDLPNELKRELLDEFYAQPWNRYPDVFPTQLIEALSHYVGVPQESIIAANGSNELMYTALMAIVGSGTKVLIPSPTFFLYEKIVRVLEGSLISVSANEDLSFNVDSIIASAKKEHPSLIILNSPNSPTGQMMSVGDVERIFTETDAIVLVDEAYIEFAEMPSVFPLLQRYDRLIILRTFSKAFSLAGLRIGYLLAQPALCSELLKPKIPFTVNNFSTAVAIKLMQQQQLINERIAYIKKQKMFLYENLGQIDTIKVFPSQTNFLIFTVKNGATALFENLLSENVLIRDVSSYPMLNNTLRVNAGTETENKAFLTALKKYL